MDDVVEKLKTILTTIGTWKLKALKESLAYDYDLERREKIIHRMVELANERPDLRIHIRFALCQLAPDRPVSDDPPRNLETLRHSPLMKTAARAMLTLWTDEEIRCAVRDTPYEWLKLLVAEWLRQVLMPKADLPSVFAALGASEEPIASTLRRMVRIDRKPGGIGRKREREVAESSIVSDEEPSPIDVAIDPHTPDPAEVVADEDAVERMLAQFGERTSQLLRLRLQGYSLSEAAQQLEIAPSTARNLLQRARKKIEQYLKNRL
jgi:RNA polymerase sigma factor (sigma-70 family)